MVSFATPCLHSFVGSSCARKQAPSCICWSGFLKDAVRLRRYIQLIQIPDTPMTRWFLIASLNFEFAQTQVSTYESCHDFNDAFITHPRVTLQLRKHCISARDLHFVSITEASLCKAVLTVTWLGLLSWSAYVTVPSLSITIAHLPFLSPIPAAQP